MDFQITDDLKMMVGLAMIAGAMENFGLINLGDDSEKTTRELMSILEKWDDERMKSRTFYEYARRVLMERFEGDKGMLDF